MLPLVSYQKREGPFTNANGQIVYLRSVTGYRQKRPYDIPTAYRMTVYRTLYGPTSADSWSEAPRPAVYSPSFDRAYTAASNRAYATWYAKISSEAAQFGATLTAEREKTWSTLVNVITRILSAARSVKRLHFFEAARTLGIPYKERRKRELIGWKWVHAKRKEKSNFDRSVYRPKDFKFKLQGKRVKRGYMIRVPIYQKRTYVEFGQQREVFKSLANGWLLFSYGVKPLAEDCYAVMKTLTSDVKPRTVRSRKCSAKAEYVVSSDTSGNRMVRSLDVGIVMRGDVKVINHDIFLLSKMGLTNPVQWVLEGIPFSFVVDWFSNLSDVVNAMTELGGLSITGTCTSERHTQTETRTLVYPLSAKANSHQKVRFDQIRKLGYQPPKLQFAYERFGWQRGLNAISLLVGFLPRTTR